jgi:hypothetical protein
MLFLIDYMRWLSRLLISRGISSGPMLVRRGVMDSEDQEVLQYADNLYLSAMAVNTVSADAITVSADAIAVSADAVSQVSQVPVASVASPRTRYERNREDAARYRKRRKHELRPASTLLNGHPGPGAPSSGLSPW